MDLDVLQSLTSESLAPLNIETENFAASSLATNPLITNSSPQPHTEVLLHGGSDFWYLNGLPHTQNLGLLNSMPMEPSLPHVLTNPSIHEANIETRIRAASSPRITKSLTMRMWEYAHDFGPRIIWPPEGCVNCDELDPEGVAPMFRRSIMTLSQVAPAEPEFQHVSHFYSNFLTRIFYDYSPIDTIARWIFRRFHASTSSKYGNLALAALYRADYQKSMLAASWRAEAKELYSLAVLQFPRDLEDDSLSPWAKLTGLLGIMDFEYHTGQLPKYYTHITQCVPLIKAIIGGDTIDLFNLRGEQMFDVSMWVWCDILDSMATSRPTRIKYESDLERAAQPGTEENGPCEDKGLEWLYGIPNAFAVILARTSTLRDAKLSEEEKASKGAELEQLVRNWQLRLLETKGSRLRVARMGAQEIWRHTAIIYIHHAIFKSKPSHPIVRDSVKNIINIASTFESGRSPDCSLHIPYFITGFYALSQKDRYIMKSRLIGCGNALYLRVLARNLDELWQESDSVGRLASWSEKKPPRIAF
ncbi:hypothetical protein RSOLAG22IIIB_05219 [Rhizoctonia solani]|uniref:Uncharacterized protein n=1 Tax=Rhizoctonia solani TaxID=456999 RepID=A0A0K6G4T7_9AGAM|nr:hypothetical protein RSOLAG22IIIB_05219 [Rhizoctonia solani]